MKHPPSPTAPLSFRSLTNCVLRRRVTDRYASVAPSKTILVSDTITSTPLRRSSSGTMPRKISPSCQSILAVLQADSASLGGTLLSPQVAEPSVPAVHGLSPQRSHRHDHPHECGRGRSGSHLGLYVLVGLGAPYDKSCSHRFQCQIKGLQLAPRGRR